MRQSKLWLLISLCGAGLVSSGCGNQSAEAAAAAITGGDAARGSATIFKYGCGSCHTIAGLKYAHGLVGPPLTGLRNRMYVAGILQNTPDNLVRWIHDPKSVNEKTAMPTLGVSQQEATDIAAYIYSIK